jgi:plastocyanin
MLETLVLINLALCFLFGTILFNRKYDLSKLYGAESKSLGVAFLLLMAFTLNMMPLVSAADSDNDGVDDANDDCPDTVEQDGWSVADNGCSYPSYLDDVWLCIDGGIMVQDLTGNDDEECRVSLSYDEAYMIITTPGIANHDMEGGPGGEIDSQDYSWKLPLVPVDDDDCNPDVSTDGCEMAPDRGPVAVAVNGVPFYGPEDGPGGDAVASHIGIYEEDRQEIELGICGAHAGPGGTYHYHYGGNCMHWHGDSSNENHDISITDDKDFSPEDLTINIGDTVTWTNDDDSPHTITADDDQFNSGNMEEGATWSYTFTEVGTYDYHCNYHGSMTGSVTVVNPEIVWTDYDFSKIDSASTSAIIGFAFDGYPIYGAYGTVDDEVTLMRSNYVLKDGETGYNGIDDYVYSADNGGHLDACNGVFSETSEFPDGIYHYHSTMPVEGDNPSANNAFPYFINCYAGIVESSNFDGGDMPGPPDADGDGIGDGWDMCADTNDTTYPNGKPIYPRGCTEEQFAILSSDDQDDAKVAYSEDNPPAPPDEDGDGIVDSQDDCDSTETGKLVFRDGCNHGWVSGDGDSDGDGFADNFDAFPTNSSEWADSDSDGVGDNSDVFPTNSNEWADSDSDGVGDNSDVFPTNSNEWADSDSDSVGDNSDLCWYTNTDTIVDNEGCSNDQRLDDDDDNVNNQDDLCPQEKASGHDTDADGCIDDSDNDGIKNDVDVCPFDSTDSCLANLEGNNETFIEGCTYESAKNYNPDATDDDGSCEYSVEESSSIGFLAILGCLIIALRRK